MEKTKNYISTLAMLLFIVRAVLIAVFTVVTRNDFYSQQYVKNEIDVATGMSFADLDRATKALLDYLADERGDIYIVVEKHGISSACFNARETLHMIDVKRLYQNAYHVMYYAGIGTLVLYALLYFTKKSNRNFARTVKKGYIVGLCIFLFIFAVLGIFMAVDFNTFWTGFHHVFFDNDLWLLDIHTCTMIQMLPEELFFAMCIKILFRFGLIFIAFSRLVALLCGKKAEKAAAALT